MAIYRLRASSLAELGDCALRWYAKHVLNKRSPLRPPAAIGTAVHKSTAAHDTARIRGTSPKAVDSVSVAIDYLQHPDDDVLWTGMTRNQAEGVAAKVHGAYCTEIAPQRDYMDVERTLPPLRIEVAPDVTFEITGTLDRIRREGAKRGVSDVKTGGNAVSTSGHANVRAHGPQLAVYELLYESGYGTRLELPPEVIGLSTGTKGRVATADMPNARAALRGTPHQAGYLKMVAQYFKSGLFPPNPSSMLCGEKYCPYFKECPYHD